MTVGLREGGADIVIPIFQDDTFDSVKHRLKDFYSSYGLNNVVSDEENSWMVKHDHEAGKYASAETKDNKIFVTAWNVPIPDEYRFFSTKAP